MQAIIEAKALQQAVKQAGKVAGKRSSMPILNTVRIDAGRDGLTVSATNLETWGSAAVECLTDKDGGPDSVLVSASILAKLTGKLPEGEVLLTSGASCGTLTIGGASIPTLTLEDYPEQAADTGRQMIGAIDGAAFKGLAKRLKAASKKGPITRIALTGVNVIYGAGRVKFAATDGYRLLLEEYTAGCSESGSVLVDASELARIATLVKAADVVTLEALPGDPARLVVSFASAVYHLRGIPEEFPDFERVIPKGNPVEFSVDRKALLAAVQRGLIVANPMSGAVTLSMNDDGGGTTVLEMSSTSRDKGAYHENVRLEDTAYIDSGSSVVSFNGGYLEDVLKLGKSPTVRVSLGACLQAGRFSTDSDNVPGRLSQCWVVMPVNLDA